MRSCLAAAWGIVFLLAAASGADASSRSFPVDFGNVTSVRGYRKDPFGSGRLIYHNGWDIAVPVGTPVYPMSKGMVSYAGWYKGYGYTVVVDHGFDGWVSLYGHNSKVLVSAGQIVENTSPIALSGSTGRSTGPHVHVEYRRYPGGRSPYYAAGSNPAAEPGSMAKNIEDGLSLAENEVVDGWVESWLGGSE